MRNALRAVALLVSVSACGGTTRAKTWASDPQGGDAAGAAAPDGSSTAACTWTERADLGATPAVIRGGFGEAIAIDGRSVVIGAGAYPAAAGAVYTFAQGGGAWSQTGRVTAGGAELDSFGDSVAVWKDWLLVGAPTTGRAAATLDFGAARFFARDGDAWVEQALVQPAGASNFASSVALSDGLAAIGGTSPVLLLRSNGATWLEDARLDIPGDSGFITPAVSGDTIAVAAPRDGDRGEFAGAIHVFRHTGTDYVTEAKLFGSRISASSEFGMALALDGDVLVAGASRDDAVYVFERSGGTWNETQVLTNPHAGLAESFGASVALDGDRLAIGAAQTLASGYRVGSVHLFERHGAAFTEVRELRAERPTDALGAAVALRGDLLVAGAPNDDAFGSNSGSAIVWECVAP